MPADPRLLTPEQLALFGRTPHAVMNHIAALEQQRAEAQEQVRQLTNAVCNQWGDDLCWIASADEAKALPENEFLESCRRYRAKLASERGEFTEGLTISELEAQAVILRSQLAEARQSLGCGQSDDVAIEIETLKALKESFEFRVASQSATLSRLREALERFGSHSIGCKWEEMREPHCSYCNRTEDRHRGTWLRGHCPDDRGRPRVTEWTPRPPHDCSCGLHAALSLLDPPHA